MEFVVNFNSGTMRDFRAITVDKGCIDDIVSVLPIDADFTICESSQAWSELKETVYFGTRYPSGYFKYRIDYPAAIYGVEAFSNEKASDYGYFSSEQGAEDFGKTRSKCGAVIVQKVYRRS